MKKTARDISVFALLICLCMLTAGCALDKGKPNQEAVTWAFDEESGCLTFTGGGSMAKTEAKTADDIAYGWTDLADRVKAIVVGEGITRVPNCAFYGFSSVEEVTLPATIQSIGEFAFFGCSFTKIILPDSLTKLEKGAFATCSALLSCDIPVGVEALAFSLFSECASLRELTLHEGLKVLEDTSLYGCDSIASLEIPSSVTQVGELCSAGLREVIFLGDPPTLAESDKPGHYIFMYAGSAYYPKNNEKWAPVVEANTQPWFVWVEGRP